MVVWNQPSGIRSQGCFFVSPRWGKSKKRVLNAIGRRSSTRLFPLLGIANSKWWYETDLVEFDPKGVFSFRPDGESRKNAFWTQLDDVRQPGFFPCLEKPTQNGGMKQTSWNSIPRVFFRFAPMGKVEKTRFERNWTTFVNPAFCPAWKSPLKMMVWNRRRGIRSQRCFFVSPRWGKSKKRVLNAIGRRSSTRLFALLGKAHSKWWYETNLVEFDPKRVFSFRPEGESRKNAFWTQLDDARQPGFLPCLEKPTQNGGMKPTSWNSILRVFFRFAPMGKVEKTRFERNWTTFVNPPFCPAWKSPLKMVVWNRPSGIRSEGFFFVSPRWGKWKKRVLNAIGRRSSTRLFALLGKAHSKWWYETDLVEFDPKGVASFRPDGESRKNAFWTQLDDVRQPSFLPCLEKPTQNGGMKPTTSYSILRVLFRFAPMGKVEKTRFERNWTTFVNAAFCPAWKSPLKMVVWNRPSGIDPKGVFTFRPDGESRKNAFWTQLDDVRQPGFLPCLEKPTQNGGMKPTSWNSFLRVFFRFAPIRKVEKTRFERNWTTFVNPAFCSAWKKNAFWTQLDDVRQPGFLPCLEKPTQNGGMKPTSWNSIPRVLLRFAPMGKVEKTHFERNWTTFVNRLFALLGKAHSKWWYETDLVESIPRVLFRFAPMGKVEKTRFERNWTTFVNLAFCPAWKSPLKMVVWNRPRGIRSQGCCFVSPRWGKSKKRVLNAIGRRSSTTAFCPAWKSPLKMMVWNRPRGIRSQGCCFVSPWLGKSKKRVLNAIGRRSSTRLFALLGKAHSKWWYETDLVEFDPKGVASFRPDGESRKNAFWTQLDDVRQPGFLPCLEKPTQNDGMKPTSWNSIPRVLLRFALIGKVEKTRFERNWTTFVNAAFCPAWKSPLKMVVWQPTSWNSIPRVLLRFAPMGKVEKTRFERN